MSDQHTRRRGDEVLIRVFTLAEFRGPGRSRRRHDSPDDYDMDGDQRTRTIGGRVILLGDGTETLNDSFDSDMFDQDESDQKAPAADEARTDANADKPSVNKNGDDEPDLAPNTPSAPTVFHPAWRDNTTDDKDTNAEGDSRSPATTQEPDQAKEANATPSSDDKPKDDVTAPKTEG